MGAGKSGEGGFVVFGVVGGEGRDVDGAWGLVEGGGMKGEEEGTVRGETAS